MDLAVVGEWRVMPMAVEQLSLIAHRLRVHDAGVVTMVGFALPMKLVTIEMVLVLRESLLLLLRDEEHYDILTCRGDYAATDRIPRLVAPQRGQFGALGPLVAGGP